MKRFEVKFDGLPAGYVYGDTAEEARRAARAGYKRVHPDRDPTGRVNVNSNGAEEVTSEAAESRKIVSEVYEGLRLLPGMEMPAEKLRNAIVLLESAVARDQAHVSVGGAGTQRLSGGDTELQEALEPVLSSKCVPTTVKAKLQGLLEWVGLNTPEKERLKIEFKAIQVLLKAGLVDFRFVEKPSVQLYRASAYFAKRLAPIGAIRIERFEGAENVEQFRTALQQYGAEAATLPWAFVPATDGPEGVEVRRPLVFLGNKMLQPARLMRGVANDDEQVVAFDHALFDTIDRLQLWNDGLGKLADPHFKEKQRQLLIRLEKRITTLREQMSKAAQEGREILPAKTARRDLIKFVIDQVHRIEDALAFLPDRSLRDAFGELVFKDVVFRGAGNYLSKYFGIDIDTLVVEGADTDGLVGRFTKEPKGPKPNHKSSRIHTVVVPCYTQAGVAIRPASVRMGIYDE